MRELPLLVQVLGQPVIAAGLTGALALSFAGLVAAGGTIPALALLLPAAGVARAAEAVRRQRQWRQAWDSMGSPSTHSSTPWSALTAMAVLAAGAAWTVLS